MKAEARLAAQAHASRPGSNAVGANWLNDVADAVAVAALRAIRATASSEPGYGPCDDRWKMIYLGLLSRIDSALAEFSAPEGRPEPSQIGKVDYRIPCIDGGEQFEWHRDGWDIEIKFDREGRIEDASVERAPSAPVTPEPPRQEKRVTCALCRGQGRVAEEVCNYCNGSGVAPGFVDELTVLPTLIERFKSGDPASGITLTCHEAHMMIAQFTYLTKQVAKLLAAPAEPVTPEPPLQERYMPIAAELLPCPFCGGPAVLTNVRESNHTFIVGCYNELCVRPRTDGFGAKEDVIWLWNHRPEPAERELSTLRARTEQEDTRSDQPQPGSRDADPRGEDRGRVR